MQIEPIFQNLFKIFIPPQEANNLPKFLNSCLIDEPILKISPTDFYYIMVKVITTSFQNIFVNNISTDRPPVIWIHLLIHTRD